ncbi:MAG: hypothetical protein U1F43_12635 [Myxococcota bacterium]
MVRWLGLGAFVGVGVLGAAFIGCVSGGDDKTAAGVVFDTDAPFGPMVRFDPLALPVPEVPLPNDALLRVEDGTATGLAWNVSKKAPTAMERRIRALLPKLDGFGSFAPITVSFDGPLDLDSVDESTFVVVDLETGERVPLDFGSGLYPIDGGGRFWAFDPDDDLPDFLLPRDNDAGDPPTRLTHYEIETNTLIVRPVFPFRAGARHAVLLTRGIRGARGADGTPGHPIRSPFPYKAHAAQTALVKAGADFAGISTDELAFGWSFTVGRPEAPIEEVREGLYGRGRLAGLDEAFPPSLGEVRDTGITSDANGVDYPADPHDHRFIIQGEYMDAILGLILGLANGFSVDFDNVDYVAFGSLESPDMRVGPDQTFATPNAHPPSTPVPYLVSIPKTTDAFKPPFPVVIYFHGTGSSRFEFLALANNLAKLGIATVAFDQVGHGPIVPDIKKLLSDQGIAPEDAELIIPFLAQLLVPDRASEFEGLSFQEGLKKLNEIGLFKELAVIGRTEDTTGDGALQSSESFFFADPFKQCASFQQDLVDLIGFVRVLRSFDQAKVPPALANPATASEADLMAHIQAGDFNADGVLDLGGPDVAIGTAGTSLGGIHALLAAAVEPEVSTVTPIASGGGLSDMLLRSTLRQITSVIYLEVFGPLVIGCPDGTGGAWLSLNDESKKCGADPTTTAFAHVDKVMAGDEVVVEDLDDGEVGRRTIDEDGAGFSVSVPADRWDQLRVRVVSPEGEDRIAALVQTPYQGLALQRNTPEFRRFVSITQHALDRCDPIAFAHLVTDKPVLFENVVGDHTVPISTGIALARAVGVFGKDLASVTPWMDKLIDSGVMDGGSYDVDDLLGNNPPEMPAFGPVPPVDLGDGRLQAMRFAFANGRHEWIAGPTDGAEYAAHTMSRNRIALFHWSGGRVVSDDICLADESCPLLDHPESLLPPSP